MNPPMLKPSSASGSEQQSRAPSLRSVVYKSALLNLTIIVTSFPVLAFAGGPPAVVPTLAIMVGVSILIWAVTFTLFSFVSLARIFLCAGHRLGNTGVPHIERLGPGSRIAGWTNRSDGHWPQDSRATEIRGSSGSDCSMRPEPRFPDHFPFIRARYHGVVLSPPQFAGLWLASKIVRRVSS